MIDAYKPTDRHAINYMLRAIYSEVLCRCNSTIDRGDDQPECSIEETVK